MADGKTITVNTDDNSVTVQQTASDTGLSVGGVNLDTDLPWYGDAFIVLLLVALIYVGKKSIDKWFDKKKV
jgi:hypothetical protein